MLERSCGMICNLLSLGHKPETLKKIPFRRPRATIAWPSLSHMDMVRCTPY